MRQEKKEKTETKGVKKYANDKKYRGTEKERKSKTKQIKNLSEKETEKEKSKHFRKKLENKTYE